MNYVKFKYSGRFAHFLKAEANASALSYPLPPRTVVLGLIGAILGLNKDMPQIKLKEANIAIAGKALCAHWHTANLRKKIPPALPWKIKKNSKGGAGSDQNNSQVAQQWLYKPEFTIWASLPDSYHSDFAYRIKERRWHFSPCLGLSEMIANIELIESGDIQVLPAGNYEIASTIRQSQVQIDMKKAAEEKLTIKSMFFPREVSASREFTHEAYFIEINNRNIYGKTSNAWQLGNDIIIWA